MNPCIRCGEVKPWSEFYAHPAMASGHINKCKTCCKEQAKGYGRTWRAANPERVKANSARHEERRKRAGDYARIVKRDGQLTSSECAALVQVRQTERNRRYQERHRETLHLARVLHRDDRLNSEEAAVKRATYRNYQRMEWAKRNPEKNAEWKRRSVMARHARKNGAQGSATTEQIRARWEFYGNRCWMCGDIATQTDHVIPLMDGGTDWPANQRPACRSCNRQKAALHLDLSEIKALTAIALAA